MSEAVLYEDFIPGAINRWGNDAILFRVQNGTGKLTTRYGNDRNGDTYHFLLLNHKPLINNYGEEMFCPTCAKILSIGLGREKVDSSLIEIIKLSQEMHGSITDTFEHVKPMLSILEDGYYLLTRIEMIPTDGEGNFFWNLTSSRKIYQASADVYYKKHYGSSSPRYLLPSQNLNALNMDRVNHYIAQIKSGTAMTGLAYYYNGFISVLLDGHHRATAAYMENRGIDCLTIIKVTGYVSDQDLKPHMIFAGGQSYAFSLFSNPGRIYRFLEETLDWRKLRLEVQEVEEILNDCYHAWRHDIATKDLDFGKRMYPDYLTTAFADEIGDVSEDRVNVLLGRHDDEAEFELEMIFRKLQSSDPERAFGLAKRMIANTDWKVLWEDAFRYLAGLDRTEVEDIFIKYLIDHDYDAKDICRKIADEYLNKR